MEGFRKWVLKNIQYPELATVNGVGGKVVVQFIIDQHGEVADVAILKGINPALDREAIKVIKSSPRWNP
ncbi:MAG: energy transducer TonB [Prevotellaceae bacterium]|nr:energy transducer TonB [Prevotellaceae bacterium]